MLLIQHISILTTILLIWFKTNAWVIYSRIFGFKYKDFSLKKKDAPQLTFPVYLSDKSIIGEFLGCPYCLAFWLSFIISIFQLNLIFETYLSSIIIYLIINKLSR